MVQAELPSGNLVTTPAMTHTRWEQRSTKTDLEVQDCHDGVVGTEVVALFSKEQVSDLSVEVSCRSPSVTTPRVDPEHKLATLERLKRHIGRRGADYTLTSVMRTNLTRTM